MGTRKGYDTDVAIVGAGPVGLTLAMDLAWRGVSCTVFEQRGPDDPAHPKCNTTSARSMEILRRLGCDQAYRATGLPPDFPNDMAWSTGIMSGYELGRLPLPSARDRWSGDRFAFDGFWPSSERPHRASQFYLEEVLRKHAATFERITLHFRHEACELSLTGDAITLGVRDLDSGEVSTCTACYVVGCDGSRSFVRRAAGIGMPRGEPLGKLWGVFFECDEVLARWPTDRDPTWMNFIFNPHRGGALIAIDGIGRWLAHVNVPRGVDHENVDFEAGVRELVGLDGPMKILAAEPWQLRSAVAETYRQGSVFLAGDAAHSWPPLAGFGMNSGMEDAATLGWMLAGVLKGWAPETLLDAYDAERRVVGEQVAQAAEGMVLDQRSIFGDRERLAHIEDDDAAGEEARAVIGRGLVRVDSQQFDPQGLNFGIHYPSSPIICYDDGKPPPFTVADYTPSTVPGCRAPYFVLAEGVPLYDVLGEEFTLLVKDHAMDVSAFETEAKRCGLGLKTLDIAHEPKARHLYDHALVLIRPDQYIAWRADSMPDDVRAVVDRIRGATTRDA